MIRGGTGEITRGSIFFCSTDPVACTCAFGPRTLAAGIEPETAVTEASQIAAVAHVIQLAVAPVFLLSGIGAMLVVMTNRLARVVDRARALEATLSIDTPTPAPVQAELTHARAPRQAR